jgi:hypothetical protein
MRWNTFTTGHRDQARERLSWLNLEIMQARLRENWQRLRDLVSERREVEAGLESGDRRRATTMVA